MVNWSPQPGNPRKGLDLLGPPRAPKHSTQKKWCAAVCNHPNIDADNSLDLRTRPDIHAINDGFRKNLPAKQLNTLQVITCHHHVYKRLLLNQPSPGYLFQRHILPKLVQTLNLPMPRISKYPSKLVYSFHSGVRLYS